MKGMMIFANALGYNGRVTLRCSYSTNCSIGLRPFYGTICITYSPDAFFLEFIEFERWLGEICQSSDHTIESLASVVLNKVVKEVNPVSCEVIVYAQTTVHSPVEAVLSYSRLPADVRPRQRRE